MRDNKRPVVAKWSRETGGPTIWTFPPAGRHFQRLALGGEAAARYGDDPHWAAAWFIDRLAPDRPPRSAISLCCGFGQVERYFLQRLPGLNRVLGLDLAPGAIAGASRQAQEAGLAHRLEYRVADLDRLDWSGLPRVDLVIANGALHHLANLEAVLAGIRDRLNPGGRLFAFECVGPSHMDFTPRQLELINAAIWLLPPELRRRPAFPFTADHPILRTLWRWKMLARGETTLSDIDGPAWTLGNRVAARWGRWFGRGADPYRFRFGAVVESRKAELLRHDPSEGVRSGELADLVRSVFPDAEIHPCGGTILAYALDRAFFDGYDPMNRRHREIFARLCDLERTMIETGEIHSEYAVMLAERGEA